MVNMEPMTLSFLAKADAFSQLRLHQSLPAPFARGIPGPPRERISADPGGLRAQAH